MYRSVSMYEIGLNVWISLNVWIGLNVQLCLCHQCMAVHWGRFIHWGRSVHWGRLRTLRQTVHWGRLYIEADCTLRQTVHWGRLYIEADCTLMHTLHWCTGSAQVKCIFCVVVFSYHRPRTNCISSLFGRSITIPKKKSRTYDTSEIPPICWKLTAKETVHWELSAPDSGSSLEWIGLLSGVDSSSPRSPPWPEAVIGP